ncbi:MULTISPECIES: P27 family phage terminase small subunit [Lacticaseibacillus]|uniref:P27 family phage terminase small subunit n=1 Tax=Lacticaseibacillus yichunensis TaxID=2486015 RepID=A0ABW4CNU2_9LACO|nr:MULTISPECIES: P27 family phage terminase small subunit [Lacticaseibacillus]
MAGKYKVLSQSKGNLTKLQQEAKVQAEFLAADGLPELQKTPPSHLDPLAKQEYRRIVESIGQLPLRNLDRGELENYCTWYSVYKNTSTRMKQAMAVGDEEQYFAYVGILNKATAAIKGLASDLGLSVNSRMAMNMPKTEEQKRKSLKEVFG